MDSSAGRGRIAAAPEVARTGADMAGRAVVLKVDTEKYPQIAARFKVRAIPCFVVFSARLRQVMSIYL